MTGFASALLDCAKACTFDSSQAAVCLLGSCLILTARSKTLTHALNACLHTRARSLPLALAPAAGRLAPGARVTLSATLSAADAGTLSGELQIFLAAAPNPSAAATAAGGGGEGEGGLVWQKEPAARCPAGASVVACGYELRAGDGGALKAVRRRYRSPAVCPRSQPCRFITLQCWLRARTHGCLRSPRCTIPCCNMRTLGPTHPQNTQVDFGAAYTGERRSRTITLHNASPAEARFDLSFGPASEMGPADGGGLGGEDAHAAFLRLARIRVRALPYY